MLGNSVFFLPWIAEKEATGLCLGLNIVFNYTLCFCVKTSARKSIWSLILFSVLSLRLFHLFILKFFIVICFYCINFVLFYTLWLIDRLYGFFYYLESSKYSFISHEPLYVQEIVCYMVNCYSWQHLSKLPAFYLLIAEFQRVLH